MLRSRVKLGRYPASVGRMLLERRKRFSGMPVLSEGGRTLLWEELYDRVARSRRRLFAHPADVCPVVPADLRKRFDLGTTPT